MSDIGLLTTDDPRAKTVTCRLDGVVITSDCLAADDRQGWAVIFRFNEHGHKFTDGDEVAMEVRTGKVTFEWA